MKKHLLTLLLISSSVFAQQSPISTYTQSQNVLNPTVNAWTGTVQGQNAGFSGGTTPAFNPNTNTIIFGYTTATATQTIAINQALSGTGIQVGGYNYSWNINNDAATSQYGTLTGKVVLKDSAGNALQTYNYNYPQQSGGFINYSGTEWFPQNYPLSNLSDLELSFTGKDARFWAGYYGPQVRTPSLSLQYTVDPCFANPGYSPSCPGYNAIISGNLLPGTTGTQAYAISSALSLAGAGATIHGFDYGYSYNVPGRQCSIFDLFGFCLTGWNYSDAGVATVITDSSSSTIYSDTTTHNGGNNGVSGNYTNNYRLSSSLPISSLGAFAMSPWTLGTASINNMWSSAVYTPDPCISNPLSSQSCAGYAAAYQTQQCSLNPLFDPACPGYAQAQCNINPLSSQSCAGYQSAYLTQQCTLNALYSQSCPGYAEAYAKKNLLSNNTSTTQTTESKPSRTEPTTTVSNDGKVKTEISKTGDSSVDSVIETKATSVAPDATATVQLAPSSPQQSSGGQNVGMQSDREQQKGETKTTSNTSERPSQQTARAEPKQESRTEPRAERGEQKSGTNEGKSNIEMKQASNEKAKQEMGRVESAKTFESQVAIQPNVISAMSFVPGFNTYAQANVPDVLQRQLQRQYGKEVIDNKSTSVRRMFSGSDRLHEEMVNQQWR